LQALKVLEQNSQDSRNRAIGTSRGTNLALTVNTMEKVNPQEPYRTSWHWRSSVWAKLGHGPPRFSAKRLFTLMYSKPSPPKRGGLPIALCVSFVQLLDFISGRNHDDRDWRLLSVSRFSDLGCKTRGSGGIDGAGTNDMEGNRAATPQLQVRPHRTGTAAGRQATRRLN
jgi:hypothetical protein